MSSGNVTVHVLVNNQRFHVSCGKGEQSFQWLATVIQQRVKQFNLMRKSLQEESFIVTELRNQEDELINPQDKIYEHVGTNGLTVRAILVTSYPIDDWENPKINDWMQVAYIHSKSGYQWATEIEGWRQTLANADASMPGSKLRYKPANAIHKTLLPSQSTLIQIGEHFSPQDIESAFNLDWQAMSWKWLPSMLSSAVTETQRNRLGVVLKENYGLVCNLFVHYAGEGRVGQRYGMTLQEFGHCLHFAKLLDWKFSEEAVQRIFFSSGPENLQQTSSSNQDSNERAGMEEADIPRNGFAVKKATSYSSALQDSATTNSTKRCPLMTRAHFAEALVCVALEERFGNQPDEALRSLCHGPLGQFWKSLQTSYLCYTLEDRALLRQAYQHVSLLLRHMFTLYATLDTRFGARLYVSDFVRLVRDAGVVTDPEQESWCTAAILAAQLNPTVQQEQECVVFVEFLDALSRIAMRAIASYPGLTDAKKIRMAFHMISELITNDHHGSNSSNGNSSASQPPITGGSGISSASGAYRSHMSRK